MHNNNNNNNDNVKERVVDVIAAVVDGDYYAYLGRSIILELHMFWYITSK